MLAEKRAETSRRTNAHAQHPPMSAQNRPFCTSFLCAGSACLRVRGFRGPPAELLRVPCLPRASPPSHPGWALGPLAPATPRETGGSLRDWGLSFPGQQRAVEGSAQDSLPPPRLSGLKKHPSESREKPQQPFAGGPHPLPAPGRPGSSWGTVVPAVASEQFPLVSKATLPSKWRVLQRPS